MLETLVTKQNVTKQNVTNVSNSSVCCVFYLLEEVRVRAEVSHLHQIIKYRVHLNASCTVAT